MKIDGACHCGQVTYEAEILPENVGICHCTDCQRISGSAFRLVAFSVEGSFKLLTGEIKEYVKVAESGADRPQGFCPNCGTPIYATSSGDGPKVHSLRAGTINQIHDLPPQFQVWARSAHDWVEDIGSIPAKDKQP